MMLLGRWWQTNMFFVRLSAQHLHSSAGQCRTSTSLMCYALLFTHRGEDLETQQLLRDTIFMVTKQSRCCNSLPFDLASNCCCSAILILGCAAWHEYILLVSNEEEGKHWMHRGRGTCRRSSCLQIKSETNTEHESVTLQNVIGAAPSKSRRDNLGWHRNPSGDWFDLTRSVASLAYQLEH